MGFSNETLDRVLLEPFFDGSHDWDRVGEYGEPGYGNPNTRLIVFGDYWCRCGQHPRAGQPHGYRRDDTIKPDDMHDVMSHHPLAWQALEDSGVEFEWHDEWAIDYQNDKCYRTTGDSYSWQPSAIHDDYGELLTPDDDIEVWIDWAKNEPTRCLLSRVHSPSDLEAVGFEQFNGQYESGWYGVEDNPTEITKKIQAAIDHDDLEIVFMISGNEQFRMTFNAYIRVPDDDDDDEDDDNGYDARYDEPDRWRWQSSQTGVSVSY